MVQLAQATTGGVALWIAWQAFSIDTHEPQLEISSPRMIRLEFSKEYMNVYAQPTFIVKNPTKRVAVVEGICLRIEHSESPIMYYPTFKDSCTMGDNTLMILDWTHVAKFNWDVDREISIYEGWMSDALPLPVSISSPQTPMAAFSGEPKNMEKWESERCYRATIYSSSSSKKQLLSTSFYFKLTEQNLKGLKSYPKTKKGSKGIYVTIYVLPKGCGAG